MHNTCSVCLVNCKLLLIQSKAVRCGHKCFVYLPTGTFYIFILKNYVVYILDKLKLNCFHLFLDSEMDHKIWIILKMKQTKCYKAEVRCNPISLSISIYWLIPCFHYEKCCRSQSRSVEPAEGTVSGAVYLVFTERQGNLCLGIFHWFGGGYMSWHWW